METQPLYEVCYFGERGETVRTGRIFTTRRAAQDEALRLTPECGYWHFAEAVA